MEGDGSSSERARSGCGVVAFFWAPGLGSRLEVPRCSRCCRAAQVPRGDGVPENDRAVSARRYEVEADPTERATSHLTTSDDVIE